MDNPETQATMRTRHDTKTKKNKKKQKTHTSQNNNKKNNKVHTKTPEVIACAR